MGSNSNLSLLLIVSVVIVSGCIGGETDVTSAAEALPQVQEFLNENPNADITAVRWSSEYLENNQDRIQEECEPAINLEKDYYKVDVSDNEDQITVWMDAEQSEVMCAVREGNEIEEEDSGEDETRRVNLEEQDIEGSIAQVTVDGERARLSSPTIGVKDGIEFVNEAGRDMLVETDGELGEFVLPEGESVIVDPKNITYYTVKPVEDDEEFREISARINVQEHLDEQDKDLNLRLTKSDIEGEIRNVTISDARAEPSSPTIGEKDGIRFVSESNYNLKIEFDREISSFQLLEDESVIVNPKNIVYYTANPVDDDIEFREISARISVQ